MLLPKFGWIWVVVGLALAHGDGVLSAEHPQVWLEAGQAMVYLSLTNKAPKLVKIVKAESPVAAAVELRKGTQEIKALEVPAKGQLELRPGGYTILLQKLTRRLKPGDLVPVILWLDDQDTFAVLAEVQR